jgi:AcrR family transcriptional regulator
MLMTVVSHRPQQPDLLRAQLLAAAQDILVEEGVHCVTLDAVATRAQVSKGDLQYHFRSKKALIDAVGNQLVEEFIAFFNEMLGSEADGPAAHARAYIWTIFKAGREGMDAKKRRAVGLLALNWPGFRGRWAQMMETALLADGADPNVADRLLLCRMAADGFWFSQMFDVYPLDEARQATLCAALLKQCDEAVAR